ncbi:hypothetical protein ACFLZP_00870 [Patescibacteria group bacterium]
MAGPIVFLSHFLLDTIPHWDLGVNFKKINRWKIFWAALADGILSLLLVYFLFQHQKPFNFLAWFGLSFALLPDFLEAPHLFFDLSLFPRLEYVHSKIFHHKTKKPIWGILPQILIIGFILLAQLQ